MSQPTNQRADESRGIVSVSEDERHRLLAVERRRLVVEVVTEEMVTFDLRELAREVAARESDVDEDDERAVDRVAVTLHHSHLPKMAALDVITYDPEQKRLEPDSALSTL